MSNYNLRIGSIPFLCLTRSGRCCPVEGVGKGNYGKATGEKRLRSQLNNSFKS
jgi:hypothetical protein